MADTLRPPKAPNLPVAPVEYSQDQQNQLSKINRLYYNEIDNTITALLDNNGGRFLNFPHIAASDTTDQYATNDNVPTLVKWNVEESDGGFDLAATEATALFSGVYKIDYSLQFANTDNDAHDAVVWLRVNGNDVPRSTTKFTLPARKSAGVPSYLCAVSFVVFSVNAGDDFQLMWATDKAYKTVGPVDGVYMEYLPAQTVPYPHPEIPSAIGSITFVSELPQ